jgi:hypothetical protein
MVSGAVYRSIAHVARFVIIDIVEDLSCSWLGGGSARVVDVTASKHPFFTFKLSFDERNFKRIILTSGEAGQGNYEYHQTHTTTHSDWIRVRDFDEPQHVHSVIQGALEGSPSLIRSSLSQCFDDCTLYNERNTKSCQSFPRQEMEAQRANQPVRVTGLPESRGSCLGSPARSALWHPNSTTNWYGERRSETYHCWYSERG